MQLHRNLPLNLSLDRVRPPIDAIHIVSMLSINRSQQAQWEACPWKPYRRRRNARRSISKIDGENLSALWNVMGDLITPEPRSACRPHLWKFDAIRDYMTEAGKLITAKEAERRVLVLENPGLRGQSKITTSLFAGVQMVIPGDVAPAHRHSQSALRFVLEGKGATHRRRRRAHRDGARRLRDHAAHDLARPRQRDLGADVLARRARHSDGAVLRCLVCRRTRTRTSRRSPTRPATALRATATTCCRSMRSATRRPRRSSTIPTATPARRWSRRKPRDEWDACHGLKLKFSNPETGDFAMPTIGTFIQLLPKGFKTARYRSTDATVFAAIEGKGRIADRRADFRVGPARSVRGAELAVGHARGRRGFGAVQFLRSSGAAEARSVPRRPRQRLRLTQPLPVIAERNGSLRMRARR